MAFLSILEYGWLFTVNSYLLEKNVEKEVTKYSLGDNTQAYNDFKWKPTIQIEEGLIRTIEYTIRALQ
jgi:nucleoside-diphosphate-sugar epimerase